MVKPTEVRMGLKRLGILTGLVCIAIVMVISCSNNNSGSTSSRSYSLGEVKWPSKYNRTALNRFYFDVSIVNTDTGNGPLLWYQVAWRGQSGDSPVNYDSAYQLVSLTSTRTCDLTFHNPSPGIYNLRLGLTSQFADLYKMAGPDESRQYNFYVDSTYYYHDVDLEYVYQSGCDLFAFSFGYVEEPYKNTRVVFNKVDNPYNPMIKRTLWHNLTAILAYKDSVQTFWDGDTSRPKCPYLLIGIDRIVDDAGATEGITGLSYNVLETSLVAAGHIDSLFGDQNNMVKLETAAHELGHIIGRGLEDYCTNSAVHRANYDCMMKWLKVNPDGIKWCCGTSCGGDFLPGYFDFCDSCLYRMSNLDFLLEDYGGWKFEKEIVSESEEGR